MIDLEQLIADAVARELDKRGIRPSNDVPEHLTVAEYARRWSLAESTVREAIREKRLVVTRVGRLIRIAADAKIAKKSNDGATERARLLLLGGGKGR